MISEFLKNTHAIITPANHTSPIILHWPSEATIRTHKNHPIFSLILLLSPKFPNISQPNSPVPAGYLS